MVRSIGCGAVPPPQRGSSDTPQSIRRGADPPTERTRPVLPAQRHGDSARSGPVPRHAIAVAEHGAPGPQRGRRTARRGPRTSRARSRHARRQVRRRVRVRRREQFATVTAPDIGADHPTRRMLHDTAPSIGRGAVGPASVVHRAQRSPNAAAQFIVHNAVHQTQRTSTNRAQSLRHGLVWQTWRMPPSVAQFPGHSAVCFMRRSPADTAPHIGRGVVRPHGTVYRAWRGPSMTVL